jgi:hypothetical protein
MKLIEFYNFFDKTFRLHNEELNDLYSSPNIILVIKSREIRWAAHVACMGRGEVYTGFWWGNPIERDHLKDGRIILRSSRSGMGHGLDLSGAIKGQVAGYCECSNERSGSIKCGKFLY